MAGLNTGDVFMVGAVSVAHAWQLLMMANRVGGFRRKHKISPPNMEGPPDFVRALRAQQNGLEFGVPFQIVLWSAGLFGHQIPAAAFGSLYIFSRWQYNNGYIEDAQKRVAPFWFGIRCLKGLIAVAVGGLINTALIQYTDINLVEMLKQKLF